MGFQQYLCCWETVLLYCDFFFFFSTFHLLLSTQGVGQQGRRDVTLSIIYSRGLTLDLNLCEHMLASRIAGFEALFSSVRPSNPESWAWVDSSCLEYFLYLCYSLFHKCLCPVLRWEDWAMMSCHLSASEIPQSCAIWENLGSHNKP